MNKQEFLNELRARLNGLPKNDIEERLAFYEEMINDRMDEGFSEEDAVDDIGTVDEIVEQIAKETPLVKLVKEKVRPKRSLKAWEIVLIAISSPIWFPLVLTAFILCLVAYLLIWVLALVVYTVEASLIVASLAGFITFIAYMANGQFHLMSLGTGVMCAGAAVLMIFACIGATKGTIKLSKKIILAIKRAFIRKGK